MTQSAPKVPAAEDPQLAQALNEVFDAGETDLRAWFERCLGPKVARGELNLSRVGYIVNADPEIEPGESILTWERYFGDQFPKIDLDETVTILDEQGNEVVTKKVEDFTKDELIQYCGRFFWMIHEEILPCTRVLGLAEPVYAQIEALQHAKGWLSQFQEACRDAKVGNIPGTWLEFYPEVVTILNFGTAVHYLGEIGAKKPLLDSTEVRIFERTGNEVCRKPISEFSEEEFLTYCTDHVWSYSIDD